MNKSPKRHNTLEAMLCRRRERRTTLSVEVELSTGNSTVVAVIRDVSVGDAGDSLFIGIGLFHNDALPLDETINCRTISHSDVLPTESTVSLMWTRHFGRDGFLSGGRMARNQAAGNRDGDTPVAEHQSANMTHEVHGDS